MTNILTNLESRADFLQNLQDDLNPEILAKIQLGEPDFRLNLRRPLGHSFYMCDLDIGTKSIVLYDTDRGGEKVRADTRRLYRELKSHDDVDLIVDLIKQMTDKINDAIRELEASEAAFALKFEITED